MKTTFRIDSATQGLLNLAEKHHMLNTQWRRDYVMAVTQAIINEGDHRDEHSAACPCMAEAMQYLRGGMKGHIKMQAATGYQYSNIVIARIKAIMAETRKVMA